MNDSRGRWLLVAAVLLAAATLLPSAAGQASSPASFAPAHLALASGYGDLSNPNVPGAQTVVGYPLPQVEILPTGNASIGASLAIAYLLELTPNASDPAHPTVVAVAAPETLERYNSTIYAGTAIKLIATLPVYPANTPLWSNGTAIPQTVVVGKQAILEVNYSVATGSDGSPGVLISWSVSGWPWVASSGDELALEYVVQVVSASGFETCTGASSGNAPASGCASEPLLEHQSVWSSALTALRASGPVGSVAWVSWSPAVQASAPASTAVVVGAYLEQPGTSALVVAAPTDGAGAVSGSTLLFISPGGLAKLVGPLVGDLPIYGAALAGFAVAASMGVILSRRRDRSIAEELSK